jgi:hypothetical protein
MEAFGIRLLGALERGGAAGRLCLGGSLSHRGGAERHGSCDGGQKQVLSVHGSLRCVTRALPGDEVGHSGRRFKRFVELRLPVGRQAWRGCGRVTLRA